MPDKEFQNKEGLDIPPTECLVFIGHSIEQARNDRWYQTGWLQTVEETGVAPDGFKNFIRTAERQSVNGESESAIVGGGILATVAGAEMYKQLAKKGEGPKIIAVCSGRPGYLDKAASTNQSLSETTIISRDLTNILKRHNLSARIILKDKGKNTEDDAKNGLDTAIEEGCKTITFTALEIRLPRLKAFCDKLISEYPKLYSKLKVNYVSSESIMAKIFKDKGLDNLWIQLIEKFKRSKGYQRTLDAETGGINALKAKKYGEVLGGVGKT